MQEQVVTFDDFVHARLSDLLRFGRALTGDEHRGADLDAVIGRHRLGPGSGRRWP